MTDTAEELLDIIVRALPKRKDFKSILSRKKGVLVIRTKDGKDHAIRISSTGGGDARN